MQSVIFVHLTLKVKWGCMELYLFVCTFKSIPYEECDNFFVNLFFNLGIDLILVDHKHELSNSRSFFISSDT